MDVAADGKADVNTSESAKKEQEAEVWIEGGVQLEK